MRAHRIGFIQLHQRVSVRIGFPADLLKILDQMLTRGANKEAILTRVISQLRIHAVHTILHQWIRAGNGKGNLKPIAITVENSFTICQSVRDAEVRRWSPVESPYTQTATGVPVKYFSVRLKNSSQAANVFESGRIISSKTITPLSCTCASTEHIGFILKSSDQHSALCALNATF